jgi:radical SAM superfamily enzyme with C-terminal helix-hairpin-helix motif
VTGVPHPLDLNAASMAELTAIPGIGERTAGDIVVDRPHDTVASVGGDADLRKFVRAGDDADAGAG